MPFLPPNQQRQSTEGKINLPVNANKMIYKHHCIFNNLKSLKATKKTNTSNIIQKDKRK